MFLRGIFRVLPTRSDVLALIAAAFFLLHQLVMLCFLNWAVDMPVPSENACNYIYDNWKNTTHLELVLRTTPILYARRFQPDEASSFKYKVFFSNGCYAMIKLVENDNVFHYHVRNSRSGYHIKSVRSREEWVVVRKDRFQFQGWPELAAYYVASVLGIEGKPPIVGRIISNKVLREGYDFVSFLRYLAVQLLPSYEMPVAIEAWVANTQKEKSFPLHYSMLVGDHPLPTADRELHLLKEISNSLTLAYLVDDHDRLVSKNWLIQDNHVLIWDQGLAWTHGPVGRGLSCMNILCGPKSWIADNNKKALAIKHPPHSNDCRRICTFSRQLVTRLRQLIKTTVNGQTFLEQRLKKVIARDVLQPLFHYGLYSELLAVETFQGISYVKKRKKSFHEYFHFEVDDFYYGLVQRLSLLLDHIQRCEEIYGSDRVTAL